MIERTMGYDEHGEVVLTIRVVGGWDVYRLARHLQRGQVEFAEVGLFALRGLDRRLGLRRFDALALYLEGKLPFRRRQPTVPPERAAALARGEL